MSDLSRVTQIHCEHPLIGKRLIAGSDVVEVKAIGIGGVNFQHYAKVTYPHGDVWVYLPWVLVWKEAPAESGETK